MVNNLFSGSSFLFYRKIGAYEKAPCSAIGEVQMDIVTNFKTFLEVGRCGSFSAASRKLHISTSVVTSRIEQLEWNVRSSLFERSTRKVSLTDQGRRLLPVAQRIVHDVDDAISSISGQANNLEGPLRIKVPTTLTTVFLARVLARFQHAHPNVSLDVVVIDRTVNPVEEGFDLVVGMLPASYDDVLDVGLCPLDRFVVASPQYVAVNGEPQHPGDLSRHRLLNFGPSGPIWSFTGPEGQIAVTVEPHLTTNDGHMLLESALAGVGIAIVSSYMASAVLARGELVRLLDAFPIPQFWIRAQIPHSRSHLTRVQALLTCLRETFDPACAWEKNMEL
jgi:DNA-binding transcriptional LysR family regulator